MEATRSRLDEQWTFEGDRFADSFNPRRAIRSDHGRIGYLKVLSDQNPADPWLEQWGNEQIVAMLAGHLGLPCVEARAGYVEGEAGAIAVFMEGNKVSALQALGFQPQPVVSAAANREQFGLIVAFDVWLVNTDRGAHNVFITTQDGRPTVKLIDHGHTLLLPRNKLGKPMPDDLAEFVGSGELEAPTLTANLLRSNYLFPFTPLEEIKTASRKITQLGDETIVAVVDDVPDGFLFCGKEVIGTLLKQRRDRLEECLEGITV